MFSHVMVGVKDFERAYAFHSAMMAELGLQQRFMEPERPWAGWHAPGGRRPYFIIARPYDGGAQSAGNGQMLAFAARDREHVRQLHALALQLGACCEGPPGLRPHYHPHYFGAYYRDPEGNKFGVACHEPFNELINEPNKEPINEPINETAG